MVNQGALLDSLINTFEGIHVLRKHMDILLLVQAEIPLLFKAAIAPSPVCSTETTDMYISPL